MVRVRVGEVRGGVSKPSIPKVNSEVVRTDLMARASLFNPY